MRLARSTYYYRRQATEKKVLRDRIEALCAEFPRAGYRRITHQLRAEGMVSGEIRELLGEMGQWLRTLEQRIASCETQITRKFKHDERCAQKIVRSKR